jgi:hypothetical protein
MGLRPGFYGVLVTILGIAGCSHGAVTAIPTAPSPSPAAVTIERLTIPRLSAALIMGTDIPITTSGPVVQAFGAIALYSDGSGKFVPANWTSSDESVVRIEGDTLKAIARGTATITAQAEGKTATETVTVDGGIAGSWAGNIVVENCQAATGSMSELICGREDGRTPGRLRVGVALPLSMSITKGAGDQLTASTQFGEQRGSLIGTDRGVNFFTLRGDLTGNATTLTIVYWDTRVVADRMEGFIGFEVRIAGVPGHAVVTARVDNVTRR